MINLNCDARKGYVYRYNETLEALYRGFGSTLTFKIEERTTEEAKRRGHLEELNNYIKLVSPGTGPIMEVVVFLAMAEMEGRVLVNRPAEKSHYTSRFTAGDLVSVGVLPAPHFEQKEEPVSPPKPAPEVDDELKVYPIGEVVVGDSVTGQVIGARKMVRYTVRDKDNFEYIVDDHEVQSISELFGNSTKS